MDKKLIAKRYAYSEESIITLTDIQAAKKKIVIENITSGKYKEELRQCPVCDGVDFQNIAEKDRYGLPVSTVICKTCDLVQTNPRMREQDYADFYSNHYRELYRGQKQATEQLYQDAKTKAEGVLAYIETSQILGTMRSPLVLDVGCGSGALLEVFHDAGYRTIGIDYGEDFQNIGRARGLDVRKATVFDLDEKVAPSLIVYNHVFEHVLDLGRELSHISRIMAEGGYLYIQVPGLKDLGGNYASDFLRSLQNAHLYHFTLTTLKNLMARYDYELVRGNEYIHSIWRKSNQSTLQRPEKTVGESWRIIRRAERRRRLYGFAKNILKSVRIFDFVKRQVKSIKSRPTR